MVYLIYIYIYVHKVKKILLYKKDHNKVKKLRKLTDMKTYDPVSTLLGALSRTQSLSFIKFPVNTPLDMSLLESSISSVNSSV